MDGMSIGSASPSAVPEFELADRLRLARRHAGLRQEELSERTGISMSAISSYENGHKRPGKPFLLLWADVCGVDLEWLTGTGPTPRGRRKNRPPGRKTAVLIPLVTVAAGYLATIQGML